LIINECVPKKKKTLLQTIYDKNNSKFTKDKENKKSDEIFWNNLYYNEQFTIDFPEKQKLFSKIKEWINEFYPREAKKRHILSFGFITNPAGQGNFQKWHIDYTDHTSNIFIPLTKCTLKNATQYVRGRRKMKMDEHQNFPDIYSTLEKEFSLGSTNGSIEVCQAVCFPFSILKLFPAVAHRGISNTESFDRVLFFSFNKHWEN